ncbi:MAG: F-box/WD repeat-containing protein [Endozoicomonas sp.]
MNNLNRTSNYRASACSDINPSKDYLVDNRPLEGTYKSHSVTPMPNTRSLLDLPPEMLIEIAKKMSMPDIARLSSVNRKAYIILSTEEKLRILSTRLYGTTSQKLLLLEKIDNKRLGGRDTIPPVPYHEIKSSLLRHTYHDYFRAESNKYLTSLGIMTHQQCVVVQSHNNYCSVSTMASLTDGRLAFSYRNAIVVWDPNQSIQRSCTVTLEGHTGRVESVTSLANGLLASCSEDKTVRIWDLSKSKEQQCISILKGHDNKVNSVIQLTDGRLASYSAKDKTIRVWSLNQEPQCVAKLSGHDKNITSVTELSNGWLASCSINGTVRVWNLKKLEGEECVDILSRDFCSVNKVVTQLADGRLASATFRGPIMVWNVKKQPDDQREVTLLSDHTDNVTSIIQLTDGRLASSSDDKTVRVWDLNKPNKQQCVATLKGHQLPIMSVIQLTDDRLVSYSCDSTIKIWDLDMPAEHQCITTLYGHQIQVTLVIELANKQLASCSFDGSIRVWNLRTKQTHLPGYRAMEETMEEIGDISLLNDLRSSLAAITLWEPYNW